MSIGVGQDKQMLISLDLNGLMIQAVQGKPLFDENGFAGNPCSDKSNALFTLCDILHYCISSP